MQHSAARPHTHTQWERPHTHTHRESRFNSQLDSHLFHLAALTSRVAVKIASRKWQEAAAQRGVSCGSEWGVGVCPGVGCACFVFSSTLWLLLGCCCCCSREPLKCHNAWRALWGWHLGQPLRTHASLCALRVRVCVCVSVYTHVFYVICMRFAPLFCTCHDDDPDPNTTEHGRIWIPFAFVSLPLSSSVCVHFLCLPLFINCICFSCSVFFIHAKRAADEDGAACYTIWFVLSSAHKCKCLVFYACTHTARCHCTLNVAKLHNTPAQSIPISIPQKREEKL